MDGCVSNSARPPKADPVERPRGGPARPVSELLPNAGGTALRKFGFVQASVVTRWGEIVGPRFATVSAPESIRFPRGSRQDGTLNLVVRGAHGTIMQHIVPEIIARVNRFFGYPAVARVVMRQGEIAAWPAPAPPPPSLRPVPVELGDSLRAVADPELRAVLTALAAGVSSSRGVPTIDSEVPE